MKKISLALVLLVCFCACKKKEVTPDDITFTINTRIQNDGNYSSGIDSVRIQFYDRWNNVPPIKYYTDKTGSVKVSLKKDTEYYIDFLTPTYTKNGIVYYYTKFHPFISSVSNGRGKTELIQIDFTETFIIQDTVHGYGYTKTPIQDPSM